MKKLILAISFFILFGSSLAHSSQFIYNCTNEDRNFTLNYKVDTYEKTIVHTTSMNLQNNEKFTIFEKQWILDFQYPKAVAWIAEKNIVNFFVFDFEKETLSHSGHYAYRKPNATFYNCVTTCLTNNCR